MITPELLLYNRYITANIISFTGILEKYALKETCRFLQTVVTNESERSQQPTQKPYYNNITNMNLLLWAENHPGFRFRCKILNCIAMLSNINSIESVEMFQYALEKGSKLDSICYWNIGQYLKHDLINFLFITNLEDVKKHISALFKGIASIQNRLNSIKQLEQKVLCEYPECLHLIPYEDMLDESAFIGDFEAVQWLIKDKHTHWNGVVANSAVIGGNLDIVKYLEQYFCLEYNVDIDYYVASFYDLNTIFALAETGNLEIMKYLESIDVFILYFNRNDATDRQQLLSQIIEYNHYDILPWLVGNGYIQDNDIEFEMAEI